MHFQFCRWLGDQLLGNPPPVGDQRLGDPPLPVGDPVPAQSQEARRTTMVISSDLHITGHNPSFIMEPNTLCSSSERNTSTQENESMTITHIRGREHGFAKREQ
ncbi:hypothetical protein Y1Q_0014574 [Alligator mississippiensis]|uniref:Uncharacterized protein n=1 Tax=Alligator mississippiensis TaxID=8496 RepID=A0A151PD52_ALLMI|nr:hypothetical protein Y1Q_0014574 [Alligator mississippiensis]